MTTYHFDRTRSGSLRSSDKAACLVAGFAPVISLSVCVASPGRAPVTHLDQGFRESILRSSLCPWPLGPRKTIGSRPCPSDIQLQVLWFLTNPSQARGLGSSVRQRLMNLCCPLDETAANQAFWLEANPSSGSPSHPSSLTRTILPGRTSLDLSSHNNSPAPACAPGLSPPMCDCPLLACVE